MIWPFPINILKRNYRYFTIVNTEGLFNCLQSSEPCKAVNRSHCPDLGTNLGPSSQRVFTEHQLCPRISLCTSEAAENKAWRAPACPGACFPSVWQTKPGLHLPENQTSCIYCRGIIRAEPRRDERQTEGKSGKSVD